MIASIHQSEVVGTLVDALAKAQGEFDALAFDATNDHFGSSYATLAALLRVVRPTLSRHGIALLQHPVSEGCRLGIVTELRRGEEVLRSVMSWELPGDTTPHKLFSATTYFKRHALQSILGIAGEDDDDGNTISLPKRQAVPRKAPSRRSASGGTPPVPAAPPDGAVSNTGRFANAVAKSSQKGAKQWVEVELTDTSSGEVVQLSVWSKSDGEAVRTAAGKDIEFRVRHVASSREGWRRLERLEAVDAAGDAILMEVPF